MLPLILGLGAAGFIAYELLKPKAPPATPKVVTPSASGQNAPSLLLNVKALATKVAATVSPTGTTVQTQAAPVIDPVAAAASMAANALLHGAATDPGVMAQVKAFQAVAGGLTVDGKYGPMTEAALRRYVPNAPPAPAVFGGTGA